MLTKLKSNLTWQGTTTKAPGLYSQKDIQNKLTIKSVEYAREVLDIVLMSKIAKIDKKLDWRNIVSDAVNKKIIKN